MKSAIPLSLYIHIPWCIRKCPYCDFNSHAVAKNQNIAEQQYLDALIADLKADLLNFAIDREITTIFIGGGTPSLMKGEFYQQLLAEIKQQCKLADAAEITMEANPGTFEQARFNEFRQAGINRLSIGVQSFSNMQLKNLGRIHGSDEAIKAVDIAKQAGFDNINIDLMYALPQQTVDAAILDLQQAIKLAPQHISWYQLTIEKNTYFYKHKPAALPDDDFIYEIECAGRKLLATHGYQQYEVSAYSQANKQCQHNLNYWLFGDYLGIGAGAHGKITKTDDNGKLNIFRTQKKRMPQDYLAADYNNKMINAGVSEVHNKDRLFEFMLNACRLQQEIAWEDLKQTTAIQKSVVLSQMQQLIDNELIIADEKSFQLTPKGHSFLNDVVGFWLD